MVVFNGTIRMRVCEAVDLKPTDFSTRHSVSSKDSKKGVTVIDPYIIITVDDQHIGRTTTKQKTVKPSWNEDFDSKVQNGESVLLTVYHNSIIPPDDFVANCTVPIEDLLQNGVNKNGASISDIWVRIGYPSSLIKLSFGEDASFHCLCTRGISVFLLMIWKSWWSGIYTSCWSCEIC